MKKILMVLMLVLCAFTLTACGKKEALSDNDMKTKLAELGFDVNDLTSYMEDPNVKVVRSANNGKYQIEYYVFKTNDTAKSAYDGNVKTFEESKKYKGEKKSKDNYDKYIQKTDDYYNSVIRIDNTLLYVSINIDYKNDVKKVINKLGY